MIAIEEVDSRYIPMIFPVHSYCISIVFLYFRYIPMLFALHSDSYCFLFPLYSHSIDITIVFL